MLSIILRSAAPSIVSGRACLAASVPIGIFGLTADAVRPYIDQGFTMIVAGVDTVLLGNAATALVAALRASTTLRQ